MLKQMQYDKQNSCWTAQLQGDLDAVQAPRVVAALSASLDQQPADVVLDCKALDFVDSMGLGALVKVRKLAEEKGHCVRLLRMKPRIQKLFVITNLQDTFGIEVEP